MKRHTEMKIAGALRISLVLLIILLQLTFVVSLVTSLRTNAIYIYFAIEVFVLIEVFILVSRDSNSSYTIAWLLLIGFLPVFGQVLYILWGRSGNKSRLANRIQRGISHGEQFLEKDPNVYQKLGKTYPHRKRLCGFLGRKGFPVYENTACKFYPLGELQFAAMLEDMKQAKKFIFIETFILTDGQLWDAFYQVIVQKAKEGVEVRLMFDDMGSIITAPGHLVQDLVSHGVQAIRFNPIHRYISRLYINYRNHQKITVIDGDIAYTGGTNYADEYANLYPKHGHWKDTAIRLTGDAVWSLTVNFLQMWDGETGGTSEYDPYRPSISEKQATGFFQPFHDGPINNPDNPAETAYMNIISNAQRYVYIETPYLVIDNAMMEVLKTAATAGVDVRIITPKIWDKWYVHVVTRSNYGALLKAGVKIYEYTPGYIHAKTILSDEHGITGSINMDYRSFNLHFENGVWICGAPILDEMREDFFKTVSVSEEILLAEWENRPIYIKVLESILRVFAVML